MGKRACKSWRGLTHTSSRRCSAALRNAADAPIKRKRRSAGAALCVRLWGELRLAPSPLSRKRLVAWDAAQLAPIRRL